jgi:hypothetical protein
MNVNYAELVKILEESRVCPNNDAIVDTALLR